MGFLRLICEKTPQLPLKRLFFMPLWFLSLRDFYHRIPCIPSPHLTRNTHPAPSISHDEKIGSIRYYRHTRKRYVLIETGELEAHLPFEDTNSSKSQGMSLVWMSLLFFRQPTPPAPLKSNIIPHQHLCSLRICEASEHQYLRIRQPHAGSGIAVSA